MTANALNSFLVAALLAGADLGILAWAAQSLGTAPSRAKLALMALAIVGKFALWAGGLAVLAGQGWFIKAWGVGGAIAPFALFLLWQHLTLQRRAAAKMKL
jgi:hypothetical protein